MDDKPKERFDRKTKIFEYYAVDGTVRTKESETKSSFGDLLTNGYHSINVCRHNVRDGDRPQRVFKAPEPMIDFYYSYQDSFNDNEVDVSRGVVMNGCFRSNKETLQRQMIPEIDCEFANHPTMALIRKKKKAIKTVIRKLRIKQLPNCELEDMKFSKFKVNKYSGFSFDKYLWLRSKEKSSDVALKLAEIRWSRIANISNSGRYISRKYLMPGTYAVGARNKKEYIYDDYETVTSRAVHMPEFHCELNTAPWIDQIYEHYKYEQTGPIYLGNSFIKYQRLAKDLENSSAVVEGDVRRYDSRLFACDLIIANSLARLYYDINSFEIDNHFLAILDSILIKDYYTPGGYVYRVFTGMPSGCKSTSLYNSFINLVNLCYGCDKFELSRVRFVVGGDDFLISFEEDITEKQVEEIKENCENIGYEFKYLEIKKYDAINPNDKPVFFKYTVDKGEPIISTKDLLARVFVPQNKVYNDDYKVVKFLMDLLPSLGAPRSHLILFYIFFCQMMSKVSKRHTSIEDVYKLHEYFYDVVMSGDFVLASDYASKHISKSKNFISKFGIKSSAFTYFNRIMSKDDDTSDEMNIQKYYSSLFTSGTKGPKFNKKYLKIFDIMSAKERDLIPVNIKGSLS